MCGCVSVCARNTVLLILLFFRFCVYIYVHLGKRGVLTLSGKHSIIEITTVIILKELSFGGQTSRVLRAGQTNMIRIKSFVI